jgi:hypothetical protein
MIQDRHYIAAKTLGSACNSGNLALVQSVFADFRQDPNAEEEIAKRLHFNMACAASEGHADIVSYLLDHGAEIGNTPMCAIQAEDDSVAIRVFDVLFDHGLDLGLFPDILQYLSICPYFRLRTN